MRISVTQIANLFKKSEITDGKFVPSTFAPLFIDPNGQRIAILLVETNLNLG